MDTETTAPGRVQQIEEHAPRKDLCAECGSKHGYHKKKCSQNVSLTGQLRRPSGRGPNKCGNCGEAGHKKTKCPNLAQSASARAASAGMTTVREPIGREQYSFIREAMMDRNFQSAQYAMTNKMSPWEVNAAVRSTDYENYLTMRAS